MHKRVLLAVASMIMLVPVLGVRAAEDKEQKMTADQTQQRYQRKSITYLGIKVWPGVRASAEHLALVERIIRSKIELPRFDYNSVNIGSSTSLDQFISTLREFVKKRAVDRAAAEAEYEARFKQARVYMKDIDRIMNSAYLYQINVKGLSVYRGKCPEKKLLALAMGCVPGAEGMLAKLDASVTFWHANLIDESKPPYKLIKEVTHDTAWGFAELALEVLKNPDKLPQVMHSAGLTATQKAASWLAEWLSKGMKQIPDFKLKTPVQAALSDGVEFMLGKGEGVRMDDTYEVAEFNAAGKKSLIGYVKVRKIGDAKGTGEGTPSYAEKVKEKRKFVGGEQLFEHPMIGLSVGASFIFEFAVKDVLGQDGAGLYPGGAVYVDYDLAPLFNWPEFYVSTEVDFLYVPTDYTGWSVYLIHGMAGFKKKWYAESLIFTLGLRGGISYYQVETGFGSYEGDSIGAGADAYFGIEYYIIPEFSFFSKIGGRFFTNPLDAAVLQGDVDPEMGGFVQLGVIGSF
ncbi:MAG: hypothetical protein D6806_18280 [Deltaproteobacteria bacterium]|nr:MAG: hypothetical protein D6806_18280 [Deltaproteobacteria bacterium]